MCMDLYCVVWCWLLYLCVVGLKVVFLYLMLIGVGVVVGYFVNNCLML